LEPSEHTTVVPELGGTTTVVDFSGGAGLLLLIQADSPISMHSEANAIFIMNFPLGQTRRTPNNPDTLTTSASVASHPCTAPAVSVILRSTG
jgi:hypothetical protein